MSCDLSLGRLEPCKGSMGGIKAVYFINFGDLVSADITLDAEDNITSVGTGIVAYKYEVRDSSQYTENITSSRENGTTFFEQNTDLTFKHLDSATRKEIKAMAYGRPNIVIEDYNGNFLLAGEENGCDMTSGTIVTGSAAGDLSGYTATMQGREKAPARFLVPESSSGDVMSDVGFVITEGV